MNFCLQVCTVHAWIHAHWQQLEGKNHFVKARIRHKHEGAPGDVMYMYHVPHQLPDYQTYCKQYAKICPSPNNYMDFSEENNTKCKIGFTFTVLLCTVKKFRFLFQT